MSRLVLVRHGQASFSSDPDRAFEDYDRLSDLGLEQAAALGEELVRAGVSFDRVYSGPLLRQRQTADQVGAVYESSGRAWPAVTEVEELAEHHGSRVVRHALGQPENEEAFSRLSSSESSDEADELKRVYFTVFRRVTRLWARGEIAPDGVEESWAGFRARVATGIQRVVEESGRGVTVGVFTSGGPIGSTVAAALGLGDEKALELAWMVENATITELLFSDDRLSLKSFNVQPRIGEPGLITGV